MKPKNKLAFLYEKIFNPHALSHINKPLLRRLIFNWQKAFKRLLPLGGLSPGNQVELFHDGTEVFLDIISEIKKAKKNIWIEMYLIQLDTFGNLFFSALQEAQKRGCDVRVIYDHFGSPSPSKTSIRLHAFNPIWPWRKKGPFLFRNHRKLILIDQQIAYCGSLNITKDYAGPSLLGTGRFRDTVAKIRGPSVLDLAELFLQSFRETTGEPSFLEPYPPTHYPKGCYVQTLSSNTHRNLKAIQESMVVTLKQATHTCYLTTPYFLPYEPLKNAMLEAAQRGVDVRIVTAGFSDIPLMRLASGHVYGQFLKSGIRIYEYFGKVLHAKTATIDGIYASVGSYNLDHWSARRNLELNVTFWDGKAAKNLEIQFFEDIKQAKEIELHSWNQRNYILRLIQWCAYQMMRL